MNITVTGRNIDVTNGMREYAEKKIVKLEKYFHQVIDIKIIVFTEKLDKAVEVVLFADGVQFHGVEKSPDFHSSVDLLIDKLEQQVRKFKEKHQMHKGTHLGELAVVDVNREQDYSIGIQTASAKPADEVEAYLQMKVDNADSILFKKGVREFDSGVDYADRNYAALYRDNQGLRLVEVPIEISNTDCCKTTDFAVFNVDVVSDSASNPVIECQRIESAIVPVCSLAEAIDLYADNTSPMVFYNTEARYLNILARKGEKLRVTVPAGSLGE